MTFQFTKNSISLLTTIINEICDDSDEDDLIPLQALEDGFHCDGCLENPPKKKRKTHFGSSEDSHVKSKYAMLARFEDESIITIPCLALNATKLCASSLKPINICYCSVHQKMNILANNSMNDFLIDSNLSDCDFQWHLKMKRGTMEILFKIFNFSEEKLSPEYFLLVLWSLTTDQSLQELSSRFGTPVEEIPNIQRTAYDIIISKRFDIEKWPQGGAAYHTMASFKKYCGFPRVIAAVASVHFQCNGSPYSGTFINQNNEKTIIYELACDHRGVFTYSSYFWWPGRWITSELHEESNLTSLPRPEGSYYLANRDYSQYRNFITPFSEVNSDEKAKFNKLHSSIMQILRNAVLKFVSRFSGVRCLKTQTPWLVRKHFQTCLLLNNLCLELGDENEIDSTLCEESFFPSVVFSGSVDAELVLREKMVSQINED